MYDNFRVMNHDNLHLLNFSKLRGIKIIPHIPTKNTPLHFYSLTVKLSYLILMRFMSHIKKTNEASILGL